MPFIGRYTRYPIYPQFGSDPTSHKNILAITFEHDVLTPGQTINLQLKTSNSEIRLYDQLIEFAESLIDYTVIEDAIVTDGTTVVNIENSDRNSSFVSSIQAFSDPTGISGGTVVAGIEHFGLPSPFIGSADVPPQSVEYITLKRNTNYIFRFTNIGAEDIYDFRMILLWAE